MHKLKEWFEEAKTKTLVHTESNGVFLIYKGFKISKENNNYSIQDCRFTNFLSEVSKKDNKTLNTYGFVKGVDLISHKRDVIRKVKYRKIIERLYESKDKLSKSDPQYSNKLSNIVINIHKAIDLLFYYKARIDQFNSKQHGKKRKYQNEARAFRRLYESK